MKAWCKRGTVVCDKVNEQWNTFILTTCLINMNFIHHSILFSTCAYLLCFAIAKVTLLHLLFWVYLC